VIGAAFGMASFSISAEIQPVWAPLSLVWQSSPPARTGVRDKISAACASSVAGTQTSASVSASSPLMKPLPIILSSLSEALVPFIFQLPATSGRIPGVMGFASPGNIRLRPHYQTQPTKQSTVGRKDAIALVSDSAHAKMRKNRK
jgi:hypothetical protein